MRIVSVVGARPQFVKAAPVSAALAGRVEEVMVHTGQHYDPEMSDAFFAELGLAEPQHHLGAGSGSHAEQTARILTGVERVLQDDRPDAVLVYGDTNSTIAAALSAVKLHFPVAHLEAGLRSFNRRMPEEHNRVLTDHAADLLLAPTEVAAQHLANEGLADRTVVVGDVMTDVLFKTRDELAGAPSKLVDELGLTPGGFSVATIHRAENTDDPARLEEVVAGLSGLDHPVVLLAHPRVAARAAAAGIQLTTGSLIQHAPLAYPDLIAAVLASRGVVTDSGGLQKEAFLLRVPATTVRTETEWVETVELGWNVLANTADEIAAAVARARPADTDAAPYGDGNAAGRVVEALLAARA